MFCLYLIVHFVGLSCGCADVQKLVPSVCPNCRQTFMCASGESCSGHTHFEKTRMEYMCLRNTQELIEDNERIAAKQAAENARLRANGHFPYRPKVLTPAKPPPDLDDPDAEWGSPEERLREHNRVKKIRAYLSEKRGHRWS